MKKFLLLFLACSFVSTFALPCSCHHDIEEMNISRYNEAAAIFLATIDSSGPCGESSTVYFSIKKVYKGKLGTSVAIQEIDCKTVCALRFEKGKEYLVYAYYNPKGELSIIPCTFSRRILSQKEIDDELINSDKFNTRDYIENEVTLWKHEILFLESLMDVKSGAIKTNYPNGNPTGRGKFKDGLADGEWTYFYPDGSLKGIGEYENGKKTGFWIEYAPYYSTHQDPNNDQERKRFLVKSSGNYLEGLKNGRWERIGLDGSIQPFYYKKGKFTGEKE